MSEARIEYLTAAQRAELEAKLAELEGPRRKAASEEGYTYSAALKGSGITWDEANLHEWLKNPKAKVPGTKMIFQGYPDDKKINDVIAYLKTQS